MKKIAVVASIFLVLAVTEVTARDKNKDAIAARKAAFTLIVTNFGPMRAMAEGKMPFDKEQFAQRAANLEVLSKMPWEFYIEGSDKGDTEAKPEIWSKGADYKLAAENFQKEAAKLALISKSGDDKAMVAQMDATAKTCKACHKEFKRK